MKPINFFSAVGIGLLIFLVAILLSQPLKTIATDGASYWLSQVSLKLILIILSLLAAKAFRVPWTEFSLTQNRNARKTRKYVLLSLTLGALGSSFVLVSGIPRIPGLSDLSFLQVILVIWLWSSVSEEIFARGFVQGLLRDSTRVFYLGKINISSGTLASAIVFSAIHISIYFGGGSFSTTLTIMTLTFCLGLLAGKAREEINLLSAIYTHIAFNIGGVVGGIIANLASFLLTGERIV